MFFIMSYICSIISQTNKYAEDVIYLDDCDYRSIITQEFVVILQNNNIYTVNFTFDLLYSYDCYVCIKYYDFTIAEEPSREPLDPAPSAPMPLNDKQLIIFIENNYCTKQMFLEFYDNLQ